MFYFPIMVGGLLLTLAALLIIAYTSGIRKGHKNARQPLEVAHVRIQELEGHLRDKEAIINFQRRSH
ncbi:hypothetical protein ACFST9_12675 [Hymenobacter monticola]|uniref:Phage shock protein B n=1 Tax=Hymenobacter monticola TaxID=1705399 RepID=A0ABY4BBC1_9BACT|nr:hypothetical protein [Hymenobacter monticola]UOE36472.1 hypothetical protein MTP16_23580 [Hymenobacter monticola]